jgi:hypothetical protein
MHDGNNCFSAKEFANPKLDEVTHGKGCCDITLDAEQVDGRNDCEVVCGTLENK